MAGNGQSNGKGRRAMVGEKKMREQGDDLVEFYR
jgi:hypothetical protein